MDGFSHPDLSNRSIKVRDKHIIYTKRESEGQRHIDMFMDECLHVCTLHARNSRYRERGVKRETEAGDRRK
jgi:hypothetical protein